MNFKDNKAIYLQIADRIGDQILSGALTPEGKVPSVRELAAEIEVNANTVARTYEYLQQSGIIYTKRGLGYFVAPGAREIVLEAERKSFLENDWPRLLKRAALLDIDLKKLV